MRFAFDFDLLLEHKKRKFPLNIQLGELQNNFLAEIDGQLLTEVVDQLKEEVRNHDVIGIDTEQKSNHILGMLDKVKSRKYNFRRQNIEQAQKFNAFYKEANIELPHQEKKYPCSYCGQRSFTTNASLHSHFRSCQQYREANPIRDEEPRRRRENNENINFGFQRVVRMQSPEKPVQPKKLAVEIITHENKQFEEFKKDSENRFKRCIPQSMIFQSEIFMDED